MEELKGIFIAWQNCETAQLFKGANDISLASIGSAIEIDAKTDAIASYFVKWISQKKKEGTTDDQAAKIEEIFADPKIGYVIKKLKKTVTPNLFSQKNASNNCEAYCKKTVLSDRKMSEIDKRKLFEITLPYACLMYIAKSSKVDKAYYPTREDTEEGSKSPDGFHTFFKVPKTVSTRTSNKTAENTMRRLEAVFRVSTGKDDDTLGSFRLNWPPNVEMYLRSMSSIVLLERRLRVLRYMCLAHSMFSTDKATFHLNLVLLNKKTDILKKGYPLVQGNLVQEDPAVPVLLEENALVLQAYLSEESVMSKEGSEHSLIDVFTEDQIREIKDLKKTQTEMYRDQLNSNPSLLFSWLEEDLSQAKYFELLESHYFDDQLAELVEMAIKVPGRNTVITRIRHMCDLLEDLEKWADAYNEVSRLSKPTASHNQIKDLEDELARVNAEILKRTNGE